MSKDDFQKVLDSLLRQDPAASNPSSGSVTSILSKLLSATKASAVKPIASLRALLPATQKQTAPPVNSLGPPIATRSSSPSESTAGGTFDGGAFANQFQKLSAGLTSRSVAGATAAQARHLLAQSTSTTRTSGAQSSGNVVTNILSKIPGLSFAVSPIISGIIGLFHEQKAAPPALLPFVLPSSVRVDAAIGKSDQFLASSHGANGLPKLNSNASAIGAAQQINVTAPAMDGRFFLDHSDQIALAVKDAMLHSSSLNDVIADL